MLFNLYVLRSPHDDAIYPWRVVFKPLPYYFYGPHPIFLSRNLPRFLSRSRTINHKAVFLGLVVRIPACHGTIRRCPGFDSPRESPLFWFSTACLSFMVTKTIQNFWTRQGVGLPWDRGEGAPPFDASAFLGSNANYVLLLTAGNHSQDHNFQPHFSISILGIISLIHHDQPKHSLVCWQ